MQKFIPGAVFIFLSGLILSFTCCTPQSCFEETEAYLKVTFYDTVANKLHAPDSLTVFGLNRQDNKLYNNVKNVQPALLPLDALSPSCTYVVKINGVTDTIEFFYTSYPHLVSKECGYTYYHNLEKDSLHTKHGIRNTFINTNTVTTLKEENIRIYYNK